MEPGNQAGRETRTKGQRKIVMAVERVILSVLMLCTECDATVVITVMFLTRLRWEGRGWVCIESGFGLCI